MKPYAKINFMRMVQFLCGKILACAKRCQKWLKALCVTFNLYVECTDLMWSILILYNEDNDGIEGFHITKISFEFLQQECVIHPSSKK